MNLNKQNNNGFTLIEFLIYSVIVVIFIGAVVLMSVSILRGRSLISAVEEMNQNASFSLNQISQSIQNSKSIILPEQGESSTLSLSLEMADSGKNPTVFSVSDGVLEKTEGVGSPIALTSDLVEIFELRFSNLSYDKSETIRVKMTIKFKNPLKRGELDLQTTYYFTENPRNQ